MEWIGVDWSDMERVEWNGVEQSETAYNGLKSAEMKVGWNKMEYNGVE